MDIKDFKVGEQVWWLHTASHRRYGIIIEIDTTMIRVRTINEKTEEKIYLEPRVLHHDVAWSL